MFRHEIINRVYWPRVRKWKCTWVYCCQFKIITWRCQNWLPASVPINVLITKSVFSNLLGNYGGWREEGENFNLWWWRRTSWIVSSWDGGERLAGLKGASVNRVHPCEASILKEPTAVIPTYLPFWQVPSLCCGWSGMLLRSMNKKFPMLWCCCAQPAHSAATLLASNASGELLTINYSCAWNNVMGSWHLKERA